MSPYFASSSLYVNEATSGFHQIAENLEKNESIQ